jgi:hypothetical protein
MSAGTYPSGRSSYTPGRTRMGEPTPQTNPDLFSPEDIRAEIRYLASLDKRYGTHHLRAMARLKLANALAGRS